MCSSLKGRLTRARAALRPSRKRQAGALCWRRAGDGIEILLITTRRTGRWIVPKGGRMRDKTASESAAIEAWEEAGVIGAVAEEPIGAFETLKFRDDGTWARLAVDLFPLEVERLEESFPEKGQRVVRWWPQKDAAGQVRERQLRRLLAGFTP
ncbi:NUDIX hydrolase [Pikeienuella sp. HZG-20]|uniref:NUDIX hydrolase n=1 Tax=Paludibacillus litoralis TaxID=3133267 RepID=UPI0030EC75C1